MKKRFLMTFVLSVFLFCTSTLWGQEKKNSITLSGSVAHYFGINDYKSNSFKYEGSFKFPISPGAEVIYWRQLSSKIELGTGVNFQKVHMQAHLINNEDVFYAYDRKFRYNEISIPLLLKIIKSSKNQNHWYLTMGVYNGKQLNITTEVPNKFAGWIEWENNKIIGGYSSDHFFTDLYFDGGYAATIKSWGELSIAPFLKYRVNSTWVNTYQNKPIVGIKLNYTVKF